IRFFIGTSSNGSYDLRGVGSYVHRWEGEAPSEPVGDAGTDGASPSRRPLAVGNAHRSAMAYPRWSVPPHNITSAQLIRAGTGHGAFLHRAPGEFLGEGVELRVQRLLPGELLARVGRVAPHDGRQGALGHLLQLVDRLVRRDALEQVDVLLDVRVDLARDPDPLLVAAGEAEVAVPGPIGADDRLGDV